MEPLALLRTRVLHSGTGISETLIAFAEQVIGALTLVSEIRGLHQIREPMANQLEVRRIQLLLLDQHLFPDADLAEVMQQPGVAKLAQLLLGETEIPVRAFTASIDRFGQANGQRRHAA